MFTKAYLDTATFFLQHYTGSEPFHLYLKKQYGVLKKFGSRDRRYITQLCYSWFRAGHALKHVSKQEQLLYALFLCSDALNGLLKQLDETLHENAGKKLEEKIHLVDSHVGFEQQQLFPWNSELSAAVDAAAFNVSFLKQPDLFLRLRPGKEDVVIHALKHNQILFEKITAQCLSVSNGAKVDAVLNIDKDVVVQDKNSQRVVELLQEHGVLKKFTAWDCCAASGGKSLLLFDTFSNVEIAVSDVRENIMHNLHKRFQKAGIKNYNWFVGNAATDAPPNQEKFDVILCDVPCSGSGTWSRTPENLWYFEIDKIKNYAQLQQRIVQNVSRYLKPGGLL